MMFFLYIFSIEKQILFSIEKIFRVFSMGKNFFSMENCFGWGDGEWWLYNNRFAAHTSFIIIFPPKKKGGSDKRRSNNAGDREESQNPTQVLKERTCIKGILSAANSRALPSTPNVRGVTRWCAYLNMAKNSTPNALTHVRGMAANPRLHQTAHAPKRKRRGISSWWARLLEIWIKIINNKRKS
jgi:hypothetical protein